MRRQISEYDGIKPLLNAAIDYHNQTYLTEYRLPYQYWTDQYERLYIKWSMPDGTDDKSVWRYYYDENNEFFAERLKDIHDM